MRRLGLPLLGLAAWAACSVERTAPGDDPDHPRMAQSEQDRAVEICDRYAARLCTCAQVHPEEQDACDLARSQPQAARLHISLLHGIIVLPDGGEKRQALNVNERRMTEASLRKIVAACVQGDARLDPARCPRR